MLDIFDQCIEKVDGGDATVILTNRQGRRNIASVLRQAKLLDTTKDMFGRRILSYTGAQIVDVGPKVSSAHLGSNYANSGQIIGYTANVECPVYFAKFDRDFVCVLQNGAPTTEDFKVDTGSPQNMVAYVEWVVGLAFNRPDCLAAATGIKFLAEM